MAGTELKCLIDAMCSNQGHGLKRDEPDYERVVGELYKVLPKHSDRQIAEMAGISPSTVGKYRKKLVNDQKDDLSTVDRSDDRPSDGKRMG